MKTRIFLCLCLTLALSPLFAQSTLPPSVQAYAGEWAQKLLEVVHRSANPATVSGLPASSRGILQLDSTKTFNNYYPGPDSTPVELLVYQYPQALVRIETYYSFEAGVRTPGSRTTQTTDTQDRLVQVLAETYDPESQQFVPESRIEVFPHGDSPDQIDSLVTTLWDPDAQEWSPVFATRNTYDGQDRLVESISRFDYFGTALIFLDRYSYDPNDDNHLIESFEVSDGEITPTGISTLEYEDHRPVEVTEFIFDGINYLPRKRQTYTYLNSGAISQQYTLEYDFLTADWDLSQAIQYSYDNSGRVTVQETLTVNPDETIVQQQITYAYIENENLDLQVVSYWDDVLNRWVPDNKQYFYYNSLVPVHPVPDDVLPFTIFPNPATTTVQFELKEKANLQLFNAQGRLVRSALGQRGQNTLDLQMLPPGMYTLIIQDGAQAQTGKVVKQ